MPATSHQPPANFGDKEKGYRRLIVWQKSKSLVINIYKASAEFPNNEMFGLTSQLRRAAGSIPANIAEGKERHYPKEFIQFLYIAKGSLAELEVYIDLAQELNYLKPVAASKLLELASEIGRLLNGLINSLQSEGTYIKETLEAGSWMPRKATSYQLSGIRYQKRPVDYAGSWKLATGS